MKYLLSGLFLSAALIAGALLIKPARAQEFGTFSDAYLAKRAAKAQAAEWKELCKGAGRYAAMREAYEQRKPDPCNPKATRWVR